MPFSIWPMRSWPRAKASRWHNDRCPRFLSGSGQACMKRWKMERLMSADSGRLGSEHCWEPLAFTIRSASPLIPAESSAMMPRRKPDRGIIHVSNLPLADKPLAIGWTFSSVVLLPDEPSSWAPILDQKRVPTAQTPIQVAIEQLKVLKPLLGDRPVTVLADRAYGTPQFFRACRQLGYQVIIRLKSNRKLYRPGGVRLHKNGPTRHPTGLSSKENTSRPMGSRRPFAPNRTAKAVPFASAASGTCTSKRIVI